MASKSSSVDRDVTVTMMGCHHCLGKFPTEEKIIVRCIYCHTILYTRKDYLGAYSLIDEVFKDHKGIPFRIRHVGQQVTLMALSPQKEWTSIGRCTRETYERARGHLAYPKFITGAERAALAHNLPFIAESKATHSEPHTRHKKSGKAAAANDDSIYYDA